MALINWSALMLVASSALFKYLDQEGVSVPEWMLWRNGFNLLVWLLINQKKRVNPFSKKDQNGQLATILFRVFVGQAGFVIYYINGTMIPLFLLTIILNTSPLWTSFLGRWFNQERVLWFEYVAMAVCFASVVAVTLSKEAPTTTEIATTDTFVFGCLLAFIASWLFASLQILNNRIKADVFIVYFWNITVGLACSLIYLLMTEGLMLRAHSWQQYAVLVLMCLMDMSDVLAFSRAF